MSHPLARLRCLSIVAALGLLGGLAGLAGCGSEAAPVTAASSEFRPAGDGGSDEGEAVSVVEGAREGTESEIDPRTGEAGGAAEFKPGTPSGKAQQAPNGNVDTLVAFIDKLAKQKPQGATEEEQVRDFINM